MPEVWLPGAYRDPGVNADYNAGRNRLDIVVAHFTVGSDSRGIGRRGYFHWLVHRDKDRENGCTQYAPVDAQTWHAGGSSSMPDANQRGPGIEFERMVTGPPGDDGLSEAEPLTRNQIEWGERLVGFLAEWGVPPRLYDGPRYGAQDWRGWVNHQALDRDRSDGLSRTDFMRLASGAPTPPTPSVGEDEMQMVMVDFAGDTLTFHIDGSGRLKQNTYRFGAGQVLKDDVILKDNDPAIQPAVIVRSDTVLSLACSDGAGAGRFISFVAGTGWLDANGNPL